LRKPGPAALARPAPVRLVPSDPIPESAPVRGAWPGRLESQGG